MSYLTTYKNVYNIHDILILICFVNLFFVNYIKIKISFIFTFIFIFIWMCLNYFFTDLYIFKVEGFSFYYRYLVLLVLLPAILLEYFKSCHIRNIYLYIYFISNILLCLWSIFYFFRFIFNFDFGVSRPSYPLSNDYNVSDAHLLGSHLTFFFISYIVYLRKYFSHGFIRTALVISIALSAIIFTGSRSPFIFLILFVFISFFYSLSLKKFYYFVIFSFFILFFVFSRQSFGLRSFKFNIDESVLSRFDKQATAFLNDSNYFLFGSSPFANSMYWFDGIIGLLYSHGGLLFLLFFFTLSSYLLLKFKSYFPLFILFFIFVFFQLVTEFVFVLRGTILPFSFIFYLYCFHYNSNSLFYLKYSNRRI